MSNIEPDGDDVEPAGEEAEAEREATVMPWIWGAVGVVVVAVFVAWMIFFKPVRPPPATPQQSPIAGPASHG